MIMQVNWNNYAKYKMKVNLVIGEEEKKRWSKYKVPVSANFLSYINLSRFLRIKTSERPFAITSSLRVIKWGVFDLETIYLHKFSSLFDIWFNQLDVLIPYKIKFCNHHFNFKSVLPQMFEQNLYYYTLYFYPLYIYLFIFHSFLFFWFRHVLFIFFLEFKLLSVLNCSIFFDRNLPDLIY
jgi:hypothetical protein